jgi:hypothetical protein
VTISENTNREVEKARKFKWIANALIWISIATFIVWTMVPPPVFTGLGFALTILYFLAVLGISAFSFVWLHRFGNNPAIEKEMPRSRRYMTAVLVISIFFAAASAFFVVLALAVGGLFGMI